MRTHIARLLAAALIAALAAAPASAETLFAAGKFDEPEYPGIFAVDTDTGQAGMVLFTPGKSWYGATDGPDPSKIYGVTWELYATDAELFEIDLTNWSLTSKGMLGVPIKELAYDESTATLYGTDYQSLYTIAPGSPAALVGSHGNRPDAQPIDNVWALDSPGAGQPLRGTVWDDPCGVQVTDAYVFDPATGAGTYTASAGVDRVTDVCFSHASGTLFGIANGPERVYEMDPVTGAVTSTKSMTPGTNLLGLANGQPGGTMPIPAVPVPAILQSYETEVNVEAVAVIHDWDAGEMYDDWQTGSDWQIDQGAMAGASASVEFPPAWCTADTSGECDAYQDGDQVVFHLDMEYNCEGESGHPDLDVESHHMTDLRVRAQLLIEPTDAVPAGQPGSLLIEIGEFDNWIYEWTVWELYVRDSLGDIVLELCSDSGDDSGWYEADVIVGEVYDVEYSLHGEKFGSPPEWDGMGQWVTFGALGELPEPTTLGLLALGGLALLRRRRRA